MHLLYKDSRYVVNSFNLFAFLFRLLNDDVGIKLVFTFYE